MSETRYCARHSKTESNLACGRCGDSICPRCLVHGPVGIRCPKCAHTSPLPTLDVPMSFIIRGFCAGIAIALFVGIVTSLLVRYFSYLILPFNIVIIATGLLIANLGFFVSEGISLAVNRKRGKPLKVVACVSMIFGLIVITIILEGLTFNPIILITSGLALYMVSTRF